MVRSKWKGILSRIVLLVLLLISIDLFVQNADLTKLFGRVIQDKSRLHRAYIITQDCLSLNFNTTRDNIERVFPNYFNFTCKLIISMDDPRIHWGPEEQLKRASSVLLTFVDLWTIAIPNDSENDDLQWSFIFEDNIDFSDPTQVGLTDFISPLEEMMSNPQIHLDDGFMYLGLCDPFFPETNQTIMIQQTNNTMTSQLTYGFCLFASGITARRSLLFWSEITSYRPNPLFATLDYQVREYCIRSNKLYYVLGSNFMHPIDVNHHGIAFSDRTKPSTFFT